VQRKKKDREPESIGRLGMGRKPAEVSGWITTLLYGLWVRVEYPSHVACGNRV